MPSSQLQSPPPARGSGRQRAGRGPDGRRGRDLLISAARDLLDSGSDPTAVSVQDVVQRSGLSRQTFYNNFADLPAVVCAAAVDQIRQQFDQIPPSALGDTWPSFAKSTLIGLVADVVRHRRFYLGAFAIAAPQIPRAVTNLLASRLILISPLRPVILRRSSAEDAKQRAQFMAAGTVWLLHDWLIAAEPSSQDVSQMVELLLDLLMRTAGATDLEIKAVQNQFSLSGSTHFEGIDNDLPAPAN